MKRDTVWVQLATRIPKDLHGQVRMHCVTVDSTVMDFVVEALNEKLARDAKAGKATKKSPKKKPAKKASETEEA